MSFRKVKIGLFLRTLSVMLPASSFGIIFLATAVHAQLGIRLPVGAPPRNAAKVQTSLAGLRNTVMTAWLNPSAENLSRLPDYSQIQGLVQSGPSGQCASAYFSAGDMIKRQMNDQVSQQMGRADACAKRFGIVFDDQGNGSAQASPLSSAPTQGEHTNSNGCVVRGDSTRCPPSVSQMNNHASLTMSPALVYQKMGLSPSLTKDQLWQMGSDYYAKRMYTQAAGVFWRGANERDPRAQAALGNMYANGVGMAENPTLGMYWLGEGARGGNRGAEYAVGVYYEDGTQLPPRISNAMKWYMKSAQQGFPRAELRVGLGSYFGEGFAMNKPVGLQWIHKSFADGYGPAGVFYETLTSPRSPNFKSFDQFSAYIAQLQAVQTERTLAIMASGLRASGNIDRQNWEGKASALEARGDFSSASSCRAIGTYCGGQ